MIAFRYRVLDSCSLLRLCETFIENDIVPTKYVNVNFQTAIRDLRNARQLMVSERIHSETTFEYRRYNTTKIAQQRKEARIQA